MLLCPYPYSVYSILQYSPDVHTKDCKAPVTDHISLVVFWYSSVLRDYLV